MSHPLSRPSDQWPAPGHPITGVATSVAAFVGAAAQGPVNDPVVVNGAADLERVFGGPWPSSALGPAVGDFFANGGRQAWVVRVDPDGGPDAARTGLYALDKVDTFNLLCLPPYEHRSYRHGPHHGGHSFADIPRAFIAEAAVYCERRRAMLIVDPPSTWTTASAAVAACTTGDDPIGTTSPNAAVYFPVLLQPDPARGNEVLATVPCGAVAGVIARTDAERGVWKAPAGVGAHLVGVSALPTPLTDAESGTLAYAGVNSLRAFPGVGHVVWGARTRQGAARLGSPWTYVPVRRTALFIEESIERGTSWTIFEPDAEPLWAHLRLDVGTFLHGLFLQGAFAGATASEAYFVRCDATTTTAADVALGLVTVVVGFAPLKPAEFVVLSLRLRAATSPPRP